MKIKLLCDLPVGDERGEGRMVRCFFCGWEQPQMPVHQLMIGTGDHLKPLLIHVCRYKDLTDRPFTKRETCWAGAVANGYVARSDLVR